MLLLEDAVVLHGNVVLAFPGLGLSDDVVVLLLVEFHFTFEVALFLELLLVAITFLLEVFIFAFKSIAFILESIDFVFELVLTGS